MLGKSDHGQLTLLAPAGTGHTADAADDLLHETSTARAGGGRSGAAAGCGARCAARALSHRTRRAARDRWSYPAEADISARRISVLTPVGTALIGMRAGQLITFRTRDGRPQILTVLGVLPPESEGPEAA